MRAVMVVVLPEVPEDAGQTALTAQLQAVARALDIPETKGGRAIVTIHESADAVLRAAEGETEGHPADLWRT